MAMTPENAFITHFTEDVKHAYQLNSKLWDVVRKRTGVTGSTCKFQTLGGVTANTKARAANLTFLEPAHAQPTATLADAYAPTIIDKLDEIKSNIDYRNEYVKTVSKSLARKIDDVIITAAVAGTSAAAAGGPLTVARILEVKKMMDNANVDPTERVYVVGATAMSQMLAITAVTSADFNMVKALVQGDVDTFAGFKFITVPDSYLPLNLTPTPDTRMCFAFQKDALALAVGQEPQVKIDWNPEKFAHQIVGSMSIGAVIVDTGGVVEQEVDI